MTVFIGLCVPFYSHLNRRK